MERRNGVAVARRQHDPPGLGGRAVAVRERSSPGSSDTRTALLAAGTRLYGGPSFRLLGELTTGAVADEAGFHRQTFYRYWETHEQYVDDLVAFVLEAEARLVNDGVSVVPHRRGDAPSTFVDMAVDIARYDVERLGNDETLDLKVGLWTLRRGCRKVEERLQAGHRGDIEALSEGYERLFERWGREPKSPFTCGSIARLFDGLLHGLVTRPVVAGEPSIETLYIDAVRELLPSLSRVVDGGAAGVAHG